MALYVTDIPWRHTGKTPNLLTEKQSFLRLGDDRYELAFPDQGIVLTASHVHRGRDRDLVGELTVRTTLPDARTIEGVLSAGSFNFSSQRTRTERAKYLADRSRHGDLDWAGAVELLCFRLMEAETQGDTVKPLADYDEPSADTEWSVGGLPLLQHHPMILFGDGGAAKSYIALWLAASLARQGITVLYADWEFEPGEHRRRLRLMSGASLPANLLYVRCHHPLVDEASRLQAAIVKHGVQYVVCDSIAFAVPGRPEDAEHAGSYFRAVRSLGVGSMHLAHVTKSGLQETDPDKPFGSVFWSNGARSTWYVKRADIGIEQANQIDVALYHRKTNTGQRLSARGLRLRFQDSRTLVEPFDVAENQELAAKLPVWQRMKAELRRGALSVGELAERLDCPEDTIRKTARRMEMFTRLESGLIAMTAQDDDGGF